MDVFKRCFGRVVLCGLALVCGLLGHASESQAAVANLYTEAGVTTAFEGWTTTQGEILGTAVTVAFAMIAVFTAIRVISRLVTKARA